MKCLEKDRTRRYDTAAALSDDVQRHLDQRPIEARPPNAGYVVRKLAARDRGQIVAAAAVLLALLGGLTGTTWFMLEARAVSRLAQQRAGEAVQQERLAAERAVEAEAETELAKANATRATAEAERAEREARAPGAARDEAEKTATFMSDWVAGAGPLVAGGRDTTMLREMTDAAAAGSAPGPTQRSRRATTSSAS